MMIMVDIYTTAIRIFITILVVIPRIIGRICLLAGDVFVVINKTIVTVTIIVGITSFVR